MGEVPQARRVRASTGPASRRIATDPVPLHGGHLGNHNRLYGRSRGYLESTRWVSTPPVLQ